LYLGVGVLGSLLLALSGDPSPKEATEPSISTRFRCVALLDVLNPLLHEMDLAEFEPAIKITSGMLEAGSLSCIHQVENFVLQAGKVHAYDASTLSKPLTDCCTVSYAKSSVF
jgi:hypothetical protein